MDYFLQHKNLPPKFDALIPFYQFDNELLRELELSHSKIIYKNERIILVESLTARPVWAQDWWPSVSRHKVETKNQGIKEIKSRPTLGHYYDSSHSKLGKAIAEEVRSLPKKRIELNSKFNFNYFSWTMLGDELIICERPFSRFPEGWHEFNEDKSIPPNRAYLKLWELFTVHQIKYSAQSGAIDLGASPGGWSWVLSQYFAKVYSVDRADLDPKIKSIPNIIHKQDDAFKVKFEDYPDCQWVFSDIICTPQRSHDLINYWMTSPNVKNFVCTLKFKGNCDFGILAECLKLEGSKLVHLYQNKNEVTWYRCEL